MRHKQRRGISLGTIFMLTLTALVLIGFCALMPKLTGNTDIRTNAIELAVKLDESFSQLLAAQSNAPKPSSSANNPLVPIATPAVTSTPAPTAEPIRRFSLCATGSIKLDSSSLSSLTDKDAGYRLDLLFSSLGNAMQSDLTIATLENSVITTDKLSSTNMPIELLAEMKTAGIDAVCLGHYGALNAGVSGLISTKGSITEKGLIPYGMYSTPEERAMLTHYNANGVDVALLSYQSELSNAGNKKTSAEERAYVYAVLDIETIRRDIQNAKNAGAKVVIVSLCWGKTGATTPTDAQRELAQQMADAGADIILGTHPQAVFPVEILTAQRGDGKYHPVLCAYSLGNFFTYDREYRANLAGILLNANVLYNPADDTLAFDQLSYQPTYCWRGKIDNATRTGVVPCDPDNPVAFMDSNQQGVMGRCYTLITQVMSKGVLKEK